MSVLSAGDMKRYWAGQITANGTTPVNFSVNVLELNSFIHVGLNTPGGTVGTFLLTNKVASTSGTPGTLTFTGAASNTSIYDIFILP